VDAYDLIVLGGGSGGLATAQRAVEYGASVAVFEPGRLGGTCVNVGCVPKKVMWYAAELADSMAHAPDYGFNVQVSGHDFAALKRGRDAYVERLNGIYGGNLARKGITHVASRGHLDGKGTVIDGAGVRYRADHIVIATGGYPRVPELAGAELGITSDGFFELEQLPARAALVGSGYVAVEFAGVLRALGSDVTVFARRDAVLRNFDEMLSTHVMESMQDTGIELVTKAVPESLTQQDGLTLSLTDGRRFGGFDTVIWAIGRDPNTRDIGLEKAGVDTDESGYVRVDGYQNTTADGVYALGDVGGQAELTPVAIAAGRRLADRVFGGRKDRRLSYELIPTVLFSHPPVGTVGLSESAARARYGDDAVRVYTSRFTPMFYALSDHKPRTVMKLVVTGDEERVVGCHIAGLAADEILQGFAVAISMGARKADLDDTIAIHPTSGEELVTMR
jgi:glutathione reductase (NADPH)